MITLTKHIKINVLTVAAFTLCSVFHYPVIFYLTYAVMLLHEAAHTLAAVCIGLEVDYIALQPFGVNLRLKNKLVNSTAEEVILYLSGPLVNALAAAGAAFLYKKYGIENMRLLYMSNLALFAANLLPAAPLDGGFILKRVLTDAFGVRTAHKISAAVSAVVCALIAALGIYIITRNSKNFTVLLFALLILGNIFTERDKYDADLLKEQARRYMTA